MKKSLFLLIYIISLNYAFATNYNVDINGFSYSPNDLIVNVGDVVIIEAESFHPLQQVDATTWNNNGSTPLAGGFSSTTSYTLTITAGMAGSIIYYVCIAHAPSGMKGKITVNVTSSVSDNRLLDYNFTVFPNPVTSNSWLNISTKKAGRISIALYDMNGKLVQWLADMNMQAGELNLPFKTINLQKGTYFVYMRTNMGNLQKQIAVY
ncbi:MAG TPA: T9SS type A sorting domain-containing protein [Lacibacter sp.]|nr:T9SS type A sorting domain-containing protein [Lacibacter sp.]